MRRRGTTMIETALFVPFIIMLLMGVVEFGRISYTYYTLQKMMYGLARAVGTGQGANFCDDSDPVVSAAKNLAVTGTVDGSGSPLLPNLTPDQIQVRLERMNPETQAPDQCDCSSTGCDTGTGGLAPDFIVVTIPDGYRVQLRLPKLVADPIPLKPSVRVPYGGT